MVHQGGRHQPASVYTSYEYNYTRRHEAMNFVKLLEIIGIKASIDPDT